MMPRKRPQQPRHATIAPEEGPRYGPRPTPPHWPIQRVGKLNRRLVHPRADWIADPAAFDLPAYVREHRFHPVRQWRFDYAWPAHRIALEVDGGAGAFGRHSRPGGMRADHEKANTAQLMGWTVLRVVAGEETRLSTLFVLHEALTRKAAA